MMATDFYGANPKNKAGEHFCPALGWLYPLVQYLEDIDENRANQENRDPIYEDYVSWRYNTGTDMDEEAALRLAELLQEELENGGAEKWAETHGHPREREDGSVLYHIGCPHTLFSREIVRDMASFLENSGGVSIS